MESSILKGLNNEQREAVCHTTGPLLILAGAGSGKTRVITHRIAYLIENGVMPYNIMAITFTNKAAEEMKERVADILGNEHNSVFVSTFHSACVRFLRRDIDRLGYGKDFVIYDTTDSKAIIRACVKTLELDAKIYNERAVAAAISGRKNRAKSSAEELMFDQLSGYERNLEKLYYEYQRTLKRNNALDFDDLILKTVELLSGNPDIREHYNNKFRYIMIDEYQDTNNSQFELIKLLAYGHNNLCVVGDDDQSIYRFRGANIANILNFEGNYPEARMIKLERNYRSTSQILSIANEVVQNNVGRKQKRLWTDDSSGEIPEYLEFDTGYDEAEYVIKDIRDAVMTGGYSYSDFAILYRANSQSRLFEEKAVFYNLPYRLIGGVNFYARAEIKDILAYLKLISNSHDSVALQRIINVPRRGIGATTISKLNQYATDRDISIMEAMELVDEMGGISAKIKSAVSGFVELINSFKELTETAGSIKELIEGIYEKSGYMAELALENTEEALGRAENISELISKAADYDSKHEAPVLSEFLEEVALISDIDGLSDDDHVVMMTLHGSKGLEFNRVYLTGLEQGIFPSRFAVQNDDDSELEEERRLFYVGVTRARRVLKLTGANRRIINGQPIMSKTSCFVEEIPKHLISIQGGRKSGYRGVTETMPVSVGGRSETSGYSLNADRGRKDSYRINTKSNISNYLQDIKAQTKASVKELPKYSVGDKVQHGRYGTGIVRSITDAGRDYQVSVEFEGGMTRILLAGFAKLTLVE